MRDKQRAGSCVADAAQCSGRSWGAVDERDRFTWKQSDASLALCVVRVALSPCQSDLPGSKLYLGHFRAALPVQVQPQL